MSRTAEPEVAAVLESGVLPQRPPTLAPDDEVIVAVWRQGVIGAVMTIWRDPDGDETATSDDDDWPFNVDIETYEYVERAWHWRGTGGSDWPVPYGDRPSGNWPFLTGYASGVPGATDLMLWTGVAPRGIERVRATMGDLMQECEVESLTGAFMVAFPYPGPEPSDLSGV
ncbi:MAG TPA: hypothetical protein VMU14_13730 [Acidimicrobiales bacterium]|nr:hypothetical protein [Acidimicrobiales bacterium]